jgi:DNA-binding winged helix-turn-helix (wHTH) protein
VKQPSRTTPQDWLQMGQFRLEKCELKESQLAYTQALNQAKKRHDLKSVMEALSGLLRLAVEATDHVAIQKSQSELDRLMAAYPHQIPPMAWYCKGNIARSEGKLSLSQRFFHRYLRAARAESKSEELVARGWLIIAIIFQQRGRLKRSLWLANEILRRYEELNLHGINGIAYLLIGTLFEREKDYKTANDWFQKAHGQFMSDHNWYYHLYVLYGYARLARHQQNYSQASWYLDLVDKAITAPEFSLLRQEIAMERARLEQNAVDLTVDIRKGIIKTRETPQVSIRKQYVLLHILEALSRAHKREGKDINRGLSKAEIIEYVWKESYKPNAHDNKLYYNINRLRKLIEPDVHKPQYLLNWKEGYRLAPGLRVHFVGNQNGYQGGIKNELEK